MNNNNNGVSTHHSQNAAVARAASPKTIGGTTQAAGIQVSKPRPSNFMSSSGGFSHYGAGIGSQVNGNQNQRASGIGGGAQQKQPYIQQPGTSLVTLHLNQQPNTTHTSSSNVSQSAIQFQQHHQPQPKTTSTNSATASTNQQHNKTAAGEGSQKQNQSALGQGAPHKGSLSATGTTDPLGRTTFTKAASNTYHQQSNLMLSEGRNSTPNYHGAHQIDFDLNQQPTAGGGAGAKLGTQKNSVGGGGSGIAKKQTQSRHNGISGIGQGSKGMSYIQALEERRQGTPSAQDARARAAEALINSQQTQKYQTEVDKSKIQGYVQIGHRFKVFFEALVPSSLRSTFQQSSSNQQPQSTGGEYYYHESQASQTNFDQLSLQGQRSDFILDDEEIRATVCDLENQRVVRADSERTRGNEMLDKDIVELVLTKYCKNNNIKYKQGLNEIVAPFMFMMQETQRIKDSGNGSSTKNSASLQKLDLKFVYNSFSGFVHRYLTNFYEEEEFFSLQTALALLSLLHKYHDPEVALLLINSQVTPEMYAVPWFLTYFSNKLDLPLVIEFWDLLVSDDNVLNIFYFSVALLLTNRTQILSSDPSHLPQVMTKLSVTTSSELKALWKVSQTIKQNTPFSFGELPDVKRLFVWQEPRASRQEEAEQANMEKRQNSLGNDYDECDDFSNKSDSSPMNREEVMLRAIERIESIPCLPVLPEEVFFYAYPEILSCSNPCCLNSLTQFKHQEMSSMQSPIYSQNFTSRDPLNQQKRRSQAQDVQDLLSPIRGSVSNDLDDFSIQKGEIDITSSGGGQRGNNQQRRMTATEAQYLSMSKNMINQSKKANIHDIIKREINLKQGGMYGGKQLMSNQPSPTKGLCEQYENYRGIDLSSQRSPFKQVNKQLQAQADGMPLETESNVNDDAQEQQESHIDLINETARMKHLAMNQELRNHMNQMIESGLILPGTEHQFINSPKINIYNVVGQMGKGISDTQYIQFTPGTGPRSTIINSQQLYYEKGASRQSRKGNANQHNSSQASNNSGKSSKRGSIAAYALNPAITMHPLTLSVPDTKLELCQKCIKKLAYEEKSRLQNTASPSKRGQLNDISLIEEESHEFYYEKIRFLLVDCRWESLQKESIIPNSLQLQIPQECTKEFLQSLTDKLQSCKDIYHICLVGLDPITEKIVNKFETNQQNQNAEDLLDIGAYHESILRFFIEDLQKKGFKHISMIPGGYSEIHELALRFNFSLVNHDPRNCYHCEKSRGEKREGEKSELLYNKQFSIVGLNDILSGFKNWYDLANLKIQNLVKGGAEKDESQNTANKKLGTAPNQPSQQPQLQQTQMNYTHTGLQFTHRQQQKQISQNSTFDNLQVHPHFLGVPSKLVTHTGVHLDLTEMPGEQLYQTFTNSSNGTSGAPGQKHEFLNGLGSRNQGPHATQNKNHVKTSEHSNINLTKGPASSSVLESRRAQNPNDPYFGHTSNIAHSQKGEAEKPQEALNIGGSLPLSFVSQSSRQDTHNKFQSGACSSNASVNSSQNDGGNNLRDAISNKKIMSYKLMSKAPLENQSSDISPILQSKTHQSTASKEHNYSVQQQESSDDLMKQGGSASLISSNGSSQGGEPLVKTESASDAASPLSNSTIDKQILSNTAGDNNTGASTQSEVDQKLNDIKILLSHNEAPKGAKKDQDDMMRLKQAPVQQTARTEVAFGSEGRQQSEKDEERKQVVIPQTPEEELYYANGLLRQVEVTYPELEGVITKKTNIVYRAMKLHLKKKPESLLSSGTSSQSVSSASYPSIAYPVYLIITQYTVSVVREVSRKRTQTADDWDQNDFEELHPQTAGHNKDKPQAGKTQQPVALIESRFLMYDLIKITSRKSSAKIITFYFRVPLIAEYNASVLEQGIVQQLDQRPSIKYQFAFKRKNYHEVSASFEFSKEEDAKQCIANVSSLYKKLKNSKA